MRQQAGPRPLRRMLVPVGALVALATAGLMASPASASGSRTALTGTRPGWASTSQKIGAPAAGSSVDLRVYLAPRGGMAAVQAAVAAVTTPGNAQYRHYITPAQYRATYGADASTVSRVSSWLKGAGLKVSALDAGGRYLAATGTVSAAQKAFGVSLALYKHDGRSEMAPTAEPSAPSDVAASVLGVTGLSTASMMKPALSGPPGGFRNGHPCSTWYNQYKAKYQADGVTPLPKFRGSYHGYAVCGYTPVQFRAAYGADETGLTGSGVTVAITDAYASPQIESDANEYATLNGGEAFGAELRGLTQ